jgi:MYXO-CTERM domain-containing protein
MNRKYSLALSALLAATSAAGLAHAVTRTETLVRAKAFAFHPWKMSASNQTASCNPSYVSAYDPGDYMGLPYDWGGYMSLFTFDQQMLAGYGAGSYPADGILDCTSGLDCSGFVSEAWTSSHITTSGVDTVSSVISQNQMLTGDIFNDAGNHMAMYDHLLASGEPVLYESVFYNVHLSMPGWSWVQGFVPRRYNQITGSSAASPDGTPDNPVVIGSFPYVDSRNTAQSMSDLLDGCGLAPAVKETGPEVIYKVTLTQPGQLTVSVQDDVGVDIDVHLYTSMNTNDCIARDDSAFTQAVDCGTYYVVADTFAGSSGALPGAYTLSVDFAPSGGQACGSGPPKYNFKGGPGTACAYPGNQNLPFCNPNLGADTCLYTSSSSFCSLPCAASQDCAPLGAGSCCADIGTGENYCLPSSQCGGQPPPDAGTTPPPDAGGDPVDANFGGSAGATGFGGDPGVGGGNAGSAGNAGNGANTGTGGVYGGSGAGNAPMSSSGSSSSCSTSPASRGSGSAWAFALLGAAMALPRRRR